MQIEKKIKQLIKSVNMSTWLLLVMGLIVYSPFVVRQLNCADVNVYGYLYHTGYGYENALGRFLLRFFDMWRNSIVSTAIIIPLSILFVCLVGEITCNVLKVTNKFSRFLIGAFILFAPSVADLFSYSYTADDYCFAYLLAAVAAMLILSDKSWKIRALGGICLITSASLYQAYVGFCILLITLWFLFEILLKNKFGKESLLKLVFSYLWAGGSLVVYLGIFKMLDILGYLKMDAQRGFDNIAGGFVSHIFEGIVGAYQVFYEYFFTDAIINNDWFARGKVNIAVFILTIVLIVMVIFKKKLYSNVPTVVFITLVMVISPMIFGLMAVISSKGLIYAETGLLMIPFMNCMYILPIMLINLLMEMEDTDDLKLSNEILFTLSRLISLALILIMIVNAQCFARLIDLEQEQLRQLGNRIVYSIESLENYQAGDKLLVVGRPHRGNYPIPDDYYETITKGMISHYTQIFGAEDQIANGWITALDYYVGVKFTSVTPEERRKIITSDTVQNMNIYPYEDSVKKIGDIVVVKLSEWNP